MRLAAQLEKTSRSVVYALFLVEERTRSGRGPVECQTLVMVFIFGGVRRPSSYGSSMHSTADYRSSVICIPIHTDRLPDS